MGTEKPPEFYDNNTKYMNPSIIERYMPVYKAVADMLPLPDECPTIVDLGCGVGHFAKLIKDRGYKKYIGIDFSEGMVEKARTQVPGFSFIIGDLRNNVVQDIYTKHKLFIAIETFEHIVDDIGIIESLIGGSQIIFTLPSFDAKSHVRCFQDINQIMDRYERYLNYCIWKEIPWKEGKHRVFLIKGKRK